MHDLTIIGGEDDVVAIMSDPLIGFGSDSGPPVGMPQPRTTIAHPGTYAEPAATRVGIEHVVLGGTVVVEQGGFTVDRAGAVLRAASS